jgi:hypothetical protein
MDFWQEWQLPVEEKFFQHEEQKDGRDFVHKVLGLERASRNNKKKIRVFKGWEIWNESKDCSINIRLLQK